MWYSILANGVVALHLGFVLFVVFGGLLILKWPKIMWLHLPAVAWGALVECTGWICPLTPLENWLREQAGHQGYDSDFVAQYALPLLYPDGLTREVQVVLGALLLIINVVIYGRLWQRSRTPAQ